MSPLAPILIIDDDRTRRVIIGDVLQDEGYETVAAEGGAQALAMLRDGLSPAVILLDLMMPAMNGWEFRAEQLRDPDLAPIPVVVMTASRNLEGRPIPADKILYKPVTIDSLLAVITGLQRPEPSP